VVDYPYASGDLIEDRNTYVYSAFGGEDFLHAWRNQRREAIGGSQPDDPPRGAEGPWRETNGNVRVAALLDDLMWQLSAPVPEISPEIVGVLVTLVKKFEVTKRVHTFYDPSFRTMPDADYRQLGLYLRFAEVMEAAFDRLGGLYYLNALLKCTDTLCAFVDSLSDPQRRRLSRLVDRERDHVVRLTGKTEVHQ
jgi:hypothetical protein